MTTNIAQSISNEQLADLEDWCARETLIDRSPSSTTMGELRALIARLRAAEVDAGRYRRLREMALAAHEGSSEVEFDLEFDANLNAAQVQLS